MNIFLGILIMILILSILTVVHEWGHFIAARIFKVRVTEFAVFMGPKIFSRKSKKTGTVFSLRLFPLGGYCAFPDDNNEADAPDSLNAQKWYKRAVIFSAGIIMNIVLALIISMILMTTGYFFTNRLESVNADSPAGFAGISAGDRLYSMNGLRTLTATDESLAAYGIKDSNDAGDVMESHYTLVYKAADGAQKSYDVYKTILYKPAGDGEGLTYDSYSYKVIEHRGKSADVTYEWAADVLSIDDEGRFATCLVKKSVDGRLVSEETADLNAAEFCTFGNSSFAVVNGKNLLEVFKCGFLELVSMVKSVYISLWWLITGKVGLDSMSGPIGLTKVVSDVVGAKAGAYLKFITLLQFTALISVNLGIINALPIPGLDGSHLLFIVIELLRGGKKIPPDKQNLISLIGLGLLILLAVVVAGMDIFKLIKG
ncbi:MAG: site-2 protease family protein [Clostridia bacterium]|nr:site-2 protease family protein [Clostridia bacterium]